MVKIYPFVILALIIAISTITYGQDQAPNNVKLTLFMKCGCADGAPLEDVHVTGQDAAGTSFDTTTDTNGYTVINGAPGTWQFTASKDGYETSSWSMPVTQTDTKYPYLLNDKTTWKDKAWTTKPLSNQALASLVASVFPVGDVPGKPGESIRATAYAVTKAESHGGNPTAWGDKDKGDSLGLWQINLCWHPNYKGHELDLFDPNYNAEAALTISSDGTDWTPWSTWKNGKYSGYLNEGQESLDKLSGTKSAVTLTIYIHDGDQNGPVIPDATVTGQDGSGNSFQQTTDSDGYVTIKRDLGTWSFSVSADGYQTNSWSQDITDDCTKHAFLQKANPQVTLTLYLNEGNQDGSTIPDAIVTGSDGSGNSFRQTTDSDGCVTIYGDPGTWSFTASADGYQTNSWEQDMTDDCTKYAYLQKEKQSSENSVVGKWAFHQESDCTYSSSRVHQMDHESDSIINFYQDGSLSQSYGSTGQTNTGEWVQDGDTIHIQFDPTSGSVDFGNGCRATWQYERDTYEGTIKGDTMSGTGSSLSHDNAIAPDPINTFSYDSSCSCSWSANRVDPYELS